MSVGAAPRGRRNREAEVHEAAIRVFCAKGYAAASIQDVANEVGVLKGSLYHYIDSKEDLLTRIFDDAHTQAMRIIDDVSRMEAPPLERLREFFARHVTWYLAHVEHATVFFREWRFLTGERRAIVAARRDGYEEFLRTLIVDCQKSGDVDPGLNVKYALFFVLGAVNAVPEWYRRTGNDSPAEIAAEYADLTIGTLTGARPSGTVAQLHSAAAR
jgi:AcrR family transcriptional regulator